MPELSELERMRKASGDVRSADPIVAFLYELARDRLPIGDVEDLVDVAVAGTRGPVAFTNGWLARWAEDAAARLRPATSLPAPTGATFAETVGWPSASAGRIRSALEDLFPEVERARWPFTVADASEALARSLGDA